MKLFLEQFSAITSPHFKDIRIAVCSWAEQIPLCKTN